jgi:hypothetical protein
VSLASGIDLALADGGHPAPLGKLGGLRGDMVTVEHSVMAALFDPEIVRLDYSVSSFSRAGSIIRFHRSRAQLPLVRRVSWQRGGWRTALCADVARVASSLAAVCCVLVSGAHAARKRGGRLPSSECGIAFDLYGRRRPRLSATVELTVSSTKMAVAYVPVACAYRSSTQPEPSRWWVRMTSERLTCSDDFSGGAVYR